MKPRAMLILPIALPLATLAAAPPGPLILPGKWENRVEIIDVKMPGGPPGVAAAMRGRPTTVTSCITPQQAAMGPQAALNADKACRFLRYSAQGGRIASELVCTRPSGTMRMTSQGSYTPTSYAVTGTGVMTGKMRMTMTTKTTGRRIGGC
ncbi:MAG: hypothetical protein B7Y43_18760 [Sphingomonas sp. 28-62-20]|uniref:DUF3617 domain-containing protein n=1 Tax=Sphingomonas sp. 28-62-20 TaxID=1970433 RepID=UPI000BD95496|nr:MAG: hypothetical protein B7Y43_18760 [Sphingomonas sp. 28-62-20]